MWAQFTGPVFLRRALWRTALHRQMPAFITPYISEWMSVKSPPYCASQMDKQKNTIISQPNHHWHFYCLRVRGTTCLHIVSGAIHSHIKHLLACSLPLVTVPGGWWEVGWSVGGLWRKRDELVLNQLLKEVIDSGRDKMCTRESLFCPLAKSFPHCLVFICLFIYLSLWKVITLLGQG